MFEIKKKWRELPKQERLKIPIKFFNLNETEIKKIRNIKNVKKRLIESARIQYEAFGDIHSYLTAWIAGCGSDSIIREKFQSTQNLLNLFFSDIPYPKGLTPSWSDIKRRVVIPQEMNCQLAEETGIHIGDGNLYASKNKYPYQNFAYSIAGDLTNDYLYHHDYIQRLMKKLYNLDSHFLERESKNCLESRYKSKVLFEFKSKILKLPIGTKKEITIPSAILGNSDFEKRCIAGIIDTDFSITSNIAISGKMNNLFVTREMSKILKINNISHSYKEYSDYARFYIPKDNTQIIVNEWGLNNPKHVSKFRLFEEFNTFLPFSTTEERLGAISGKIDVNDLKKICLKRSFSKL